MKKKINVIDLDNTLLPYNSLIRFVLHFMFEWRCFVPLVYYSLLRITGILPRDMYQKKILVRARKVDNYENKIKKFSHSLYRDINTSIFHFILENTDEFTINILCTASPEDYVKYLCEKLRWKYLSSTMDSTSDSFFHMYGEHKIIALKKNYPSQYFTYHLAVSDNKSDLKLLKLFEKSLFVHKWSIRKKNL